MRGLERVGSDCQMRVSAGSKPGDERGVGVGESRQPATHPLDHLVWNGGLDSPGRAGGADPLTRDAVRATDARSGSGGRPPFASPTLMLPPRGIKADAWPPGEPRIPPLPVMPHRGQVESVRAGLLEPRHRIHRSPPGNEGNTAKIGERRQEWERRPCALVSGTFVKGPL